jgi:hypothetical protein
MQWSVVSGQWPVASKIRSHSLDSFLFTPKVLDSVLRVPPPPRSFGIIELYRKSRQVFGFKRLIGKVFRNKDLGCQRALKMGLGQFRGLSWETDTPRNCPIRGLFSHLARSGSVMAVTGWL